MRPGGSTPVLVSARRTGTDEVGSINRRFNTINGAELYTVSDHVQPVSATLRWTLYHLNGKKLLAGSKPVRLRYGESVLQKKLDLTRELAAHGRESVYLRVYLTGPGAVLSENTVFFAALRFLDLPKEKPALRVAKLGKARFKLVFRAKTFQHMVAVDVAGSGFRMTDNWFDLYPGIPHEVELTLDRDCAIAQLRRKMSVMSLAQSY